MRPFTPKVLNKQSTSFQGLSLLAWQVDGLGGGNFAERNHAALPASRCEQYNIDDRLKAHELPRHTL